MSPTGLVPGMRLAQDAGLHELAGAWISRPGDKVPNVGVKVVAALSDYGKSPPDAEFQGSGVLRTP